MRRHCVLLAGLSLALFVAGCGDDDAVNTSASSGSATGPTTTTAAAVTTTTTAVPVLTDRGYGRIEVGKTVRELEATGLTVTIQDGDVFEGYCYYGVSATVPNVSFMIQSPSEVEPPADLRDGVIVRVEARDPSIVTDKGLHIGSTEAEVKAAYPSGLEESPHTYDDNGHYLDVPVTTDEIPRSIRFETDGKVVDGIFGGWAGATALVEGCA